MNQQTVIVLMGAQGPCKTSFITESLGGRTRSEAHIANPTTSISGIPVFLQGGQEVILVEIPSLDEPSSVVTLGRFLAVIQCLLVGAIYFQRLTDTRVAKKDFKLFSQVLGTIPARNTAIITTTPVKVEKINIDRQNELVNDYWTDVVQRGARVGHFSSTSESALNILDGLFTPATLEPLPIRTQDVVQFLHTMLARNEEESGIVTSLRKAAKVDKDADLVKQYGKDSKGLSSQRDDLEKLLRSLEERRAPRLPFVFHR